MCYFKTTGGERYPPLRQELRDKRTVLNRARREQWARPHQAKAGLRGRGQDDYRPFHRPPVGGVCVCVGGGIKRLISHLKPPDRPNRLVIPQSAAAASRSSAKLAFLIYIAHTGKRRPVALLHPPYSAPYRPPKRLCDPPLPPRLTFKCFGTVNTPFVMHIYNAKD